MRKLLLLLALLGSVPLWAQVPAQFQNLITCTPTYPTNGNCAIYPSPADARPAVGATYTDPVFGTKVKRITPPAGYAGTTTSWVPNYSPQTAWSVNGTYLLVYHPGGGAWALFNGVDYSLIRMFTTPASCPTSYPVAGMVLTGDVYPHWLQTDDTSFYYNCGLRVLKYNAVTNQSSLVVDLTGNATITAMGAASGIITKDYCGYSDDDNRASMMVTGASSLELGMVVLGNLRTTPTILAHKDFTTDFVISAKNTKLPGTACISPSGNHVYVEWNCAVGSTCPTGADAIVHHGTEFFAASNLAYERRVGTGDNLVHSDAGWCNATDECYVSSQDNLINADYVTYTAFRFSDGLEYRAVMPRALYGDQGACGGGCKSTFHVSMRSRALKGYALISLFTEGYPAGWNNPDIGTTALNGAPMQAEVFAVALDNSNKVYRIAHNQTIRNSSEYYGEPHAVVNNDFTKVIFGSTWRDSTYPTPTDGLNAYVVELSSAAASVTAADSIAASDAVTLNSTPHGKVRVCKH